MVGPRPAGAGAARGAMGPFGALSTVHKDGGRARGLGQISSNRENGVSVLLGSAPGYLGKQTLERRGYISLLPVVRWSA